jgi:hypothetical protein
VKTEPRSEFIYIPRWLMKHLRNKCLSPGQCLLYLAILEMADLATGEWDGTFRQPPPPHCVQRAEADLAALVKRGYLRRMPIGYQFPEFEHNEDGDLLVLEPQLWQ